MSAENARKNNSLSSFLYLINTIKSTAKVELPTSLHTVQPSKSWTTTVDKRSQPKPVQSNNSSVPFVCLNRAQWFLYTNSNETNNKQFHCNRSVRSTSFPTKTYPINKPPFNTVTKRKTRNNLPHVYKHRNSKQHIRTRKPKTKTKVTLIWHTPVCYSW